MNKAQETSLKASVEFYESELEKLDFQIKHLTTENRRQRVRIKVLEIELQTALDTPSK